MKIIYKVIGAVVGLIVVLELLAGFSTTVATSAAAILAANATWGPISLLFGAGGVVFTIFMVGILLYFLKSMTVNK